MKKISVMGLCLVLAIAGVMMMSWVPEKTAKAATSTHAAKAYEVKTEPKELSELQLFDRHIVDIYDAAALSASNLDAEVFRKAIVGYYNLKSSGQLSGSKNILSIVDFTRSSREKRLWIIDLDKKQLLFNTLVAHGRGSGDDMAKNFSNITNSHQSSLGFYVTSDIYQGKHGLSLKLNGMDEGFNTNARNRAIVVHGADYVSESFINQHGRLGRSHGCPAVPVELTPAIIDTIKGNTCLFINGPQAEYSSTYLNPQTAATAFSQPEVASL